MKGEESSRSQGNWLTAKNITYFAVLLALVIVLQIWGGTITIGVVSMNFVLVPIVLCGMILGPVAATLLGVISGLIILLQGVSGVDSFTSVLFTDHPVITALVCIVKGGAAGFVSGAAFRLVEKKNKILASFLSSALCPTVNTGLFIIGALFMSDTLEANYVADGTTVIYFLVVVCAGINFLVEFVINLVLAPAILRIHDIILNNLKRG